MWAHYEAALQLMAAEFLGQWSPAVPRPVTTLEALLGHITEHLLQLGRGGGGSCKEMVRAWSVAKWQWKGGGSTRACVHARGTRAGGPWSDGAR